ncbi:hypothetical protein GCM10007877_36670 [Marinibactrum halimedae]|uniref:Uncharacterized protein n=1 Tax=Marinibactrum halimedae TaxID=1444977 RepID=A0AA37WNZ5_9GAMM|nr:hypothetical protein GCM10007877_36670 [Marinibactrum halimedae]
MNIIIEKNKKSRFIKRKPYAIRNKPFPPIKSSIHEEYAQAGIVNVYLIRGGFVHKKIDKINQEKTLSAMDFSSD